MRKPAAPVPAAPAWVAPIPIVTSPLNPAIGDLSAGADGPTALGELVRHTDGDFRAGAEYRAGQRSLLNPGFVQRCPSVNPCRLDGLVASLATAARSLGWAAKEGARLSPRVEQPLSAYIADLGCCSRP